VVKIKRGRGKFTKISPKLLGIIREQEARIAGLEAQIVELKATIARLQKDSRNSSKPPSSDIVKPKPEAHKNNRGEPLKNRRAKRP
jgi:hypothetical protein